MIPTDVALQWPPAPLPWQEGIYQRLCRADRAGKLPHALLLSGASGLGKAQLAHAFATGLMCNETSPEPCGHCESCGLMKAGSHGDFRWLAPEEGKRAIGIDAVRAAVGFVQKTAAYGTRKVLLIEPAEAMTAQAANALLKTLEEPPGSSVILLVSSQAGALIATVRSRCQSIVVAPPGPDQAQEWLMAEANCAPDQASQALTLAEGRPVAALNLMTTGEVAGLAELSAVFDRVLSGGMASSEAAQVLGQYDHRVLLELALHSLDKDLRRGALVGANPAGFRCRDRLQALLAAHQRGINFARDTLPAEVARLLAQQRVQGM